MTKSKSLRVVFGNVEVEVQQHLEEFSFIQFDAWVKSRFGLIENDKVIYCDVLKKEVIPSKSYVAENDSIYVRVAKNAKTKSISSDSEPFSFWTIFDAMFIYMAVPFLVVAAGVYSQSPISRWLPVLEICQYLDNYLLAQGIIQKSGVSVEAVIAYVCWSTTYLFVRRLWNPETSRGALQKFSTDSFYGGLAAAGAVFVKAFLVANLVNKTHETYG